MSVSATDASNRFGALLDTVLAGQPATITRHGRPVAKLLSQNDWDRLCVDHVFRKRVLGLVPVDEKPA